jgi:ribose transport system ATP-binding protein
LTDLLEIRHISKTFPGLRALDDVSLEVAAGEVVAVVGQNGSGKSTLVKILAGVHQPDERGEIRVRSADGSLLRGSASHDELHFIHQDLGLIPLLTTVENLDLARRLTRGDCLPSRVRSEREHAKALIARFGVSFDVEVPVAMLSPAERTIVAIARALDGWTRPDRVLVLDEPTAALHGDEVRVLFEAVRRTAAQGAGVIFISHRLDEVIDVADRIVVLRDGRVVGDSRRGEVDHDDLARMIAGHEVQATAQRGGEALGEVVLAARRVTAHGIRSLDLDLRAGEIVGVSGILGSGRERIAGTLFGAFARDGGEVLVRGRSLPSLSPRASVAVGMSYVPADRRLEGAVMTMNARENLTLPRLHTLRRALGRLDSRAERAEAISWFAKVDVRPPDTERPLLQFSGGNQQKVVMAKWLRTEPSVMLLDEPTQGVDVGAKAGIYALVQGAARGGAAILFSSSETKELVGICDRVLVMREGRVAAEVPAPDLSEERLVREALGLAQ